MSNRKPLPRLSFTPTLAALEERAVPAVTVREAAGANAAAIQTAVDAFRTDLGVLNPNNPGSFDTGRREINWDGTPDAKTSPALLPLDFFNTTSPRGAVFSTPGTGVLVSQDNDTPADADADQVEFSDINALYDNAFATFSPQRLFAAQGSNVVDVTFRVPGSNAPAVVRGFGAVFTDVDLANVSRMEFFDANGKSLFTREVLADDGDEALSFLGASFAPGDAERIARVRITAGNGPLAAGANDLTEGGANDLVALDDFIYGEPTAAPLPFAVGHGAGTAVQVRNPDGSLKSQFAAFADSFTGGVRVATADFNGDGVPDTVVGTGPGIATRVRVISGQDNKTELFGIDPFEASFKGGVYVAAGDITNDGVADLVITPDEGGGPRVRVFSGKDFTQVADFLGINDPNFRGGARAAVGDVNNAGGDDLIVAAGFGGGPRVAFFDGDTITEEGNQPGIQSLDRWETWKLFGDFLVFEESLRNGSFVAAGDVDGDAFADLIAGGGPGGGPRVRILSGRDLLTSGGKTQTTLGNFFAGDEANRGGVRVAVANLDFDARDDLVVGAGTGGGSRVTGYLGNAITPNGTPATAFSFDAFSDVTAGVFVG